MYLLFCINFSLCLTANKLVLGIQTYGRTWLMTSSSAISGVPPLEADGVGPEGHLTKEPGLLSYPEICTMSLNPNNQGTKGLLKKVNDPSKKLGIYISFAFPSENACNYCSLSLIFCIQGTNISVPVSSLLPQGRLTP